MEYRLIKPINEEYSALEQVLTNRGIKFDDIPRYLNLTAEEELSPLLLDNIEEAAKTIIKHLTGEGKILVVVDSDCDGYTSSAVLLNYLHMWVPSIVESKIYYALHEAKIHGIKMDAIQDGTTLVIAPDSSSNEYELHEELVSRGIDVIVLDHHHADMVSQYACVVNNQLCDYPNKTLSGVGIVYKLCGLLDSMLQVDYSKDLLDLVAVGLN